MHLASSQSFLLPSSWLRWEKDALLINSVKLTVKYFEAAAVQTFGLVNIVYFSNGEWSTQLGTQLMQLCKKPEKKFRTSMGFEPVTLRYQCNALTNWAMKLLMLGAGIICLFRESHQYREVTGSNPIEVLYFFLSGFLLNCINHVHNCEDHSSFDFISAVLIWFISYTSIILFTFVKCFWSVSIHLLI